MALRVNKLTDRSARGFKAEGYYSDGDGLYLVVSRTGGRSWIYRYRSNGARRDMGLGSFLDVSLAEARLARDDAKRAITVGHDPLERREPTEALALTPGHPVISPPTPAAVVAVIRPPSLLQCWKDYVKGQEGGWRGKKTKASWMRSVESHAASIKHRPVDEIDVEEVLSVLEPLWLIKAESAGKLRERLERVLDYARVRKLRTGANPALWKGNLIHLLPPRPKLQRGHMPAMPYAEIPAFMKRLRGSQGMSARALEYTVLTVARESMTLEATWGEVNDDVWNLHRSRMKERDFRQPLSSGALAVLEAVRPARTRPNQLVFPGPKGGPMSNMAMDMMLRDLATGCTPHGMRSSFRDWAGDETNFARETIEECLAHAVGDETERAYRRSDALRKRREVLEAWSVYCLSEIQDAGTGELQSAANSEGQYLGPAVVDPPTTFRGRSRSIA